MPDPMPTADAFAAIVEMVRSHLLSPAGRAGLCPLWVEKMESLLALVKAMRERNKALNSLLACYRTGKSPSEKLLDSLANSEHLEAITEALQ